MIERKKKRPSKHLFNTLKIEALLALYTLLIMNFFTFLGYLPLLFVLLLLLLCLLVALLLLGLLVELYFRRPLWFVDADIIRGDDGAHGSIFVNIVRLVLFQIDFVKLLLFYSVNSALFDAWSIVYPIALDTFAGFVLLALHICLTNKVVLSLVWIWSR